MLIRKYHLHVIYENNWKAPQEYRFFTQNGKRNKIRSLPFPKRVLVKGGSYTKIKVGIPFLPPPPPAH